MDQYPLTALKSSGEGFTVRSITDVAGAIVPNTVRVSVTLERDHRDTFFFISRDDLPGAIEQHLPAFCWFKEGSLVCKYLTTQKFPTT